MDAHSVSSGTTVRQKPLDERAREELLSGMIIGRSPAIQEIMSTVRQVALYPTTSVLLQGESGTGKDVIARAIHEIGSSAAHQFVSINCAAIPEALLETELFGVEAGAYTDARVSREGYLLRADGGTFFLDEIGSMPLVLQAKLLRLLETLSFRPVGSTKEHHVRLRIISATNVDLQTAVAHKAFRNDLLYRLNVLTIFIPPLRERPEDILPLIEHFLLLYNTTSIEPLRISDEALALLLNYSWPGNVRELRSAIQHGQVMCDEHLIQPKDLPAEVRTQRASTGPRLSDLQEQLHLPSEGLNLPVFLASIEYKFMQEALEQCNGNQVRAAALLSISRDQLRYRLFEKAQRAAITSVRSQSSL